MSNPETPGTLSITRADLWLLTAGNCLAGAVSFGAVSFLLQQYAHASVAMSYGVSFFLFALVMYCPMNLMQRMRGSELTFRKFLAIWGPASFLVAGLSYLLS